MHPLLDRAHEVEAIKNLKQTEKYLEIRISDLTRDEWAYIISSVETSQTNQPNYHSLNQTRSNLIKKCITEINKIPELRYPIKEALQLKTFLYFTTEAEILGEEYAVGPEVLAYIHATHEAYTNNQAVNQ